MSDVKREDEQETSDIALDETKHDAAIKKQEIKEHGRPQMPTMWQKALLTRERRQQTQRAHQRHQRQWTRVAEESHNVSMP